MLEILLAPEYFNLVRMGKKRSTVRLGTRFGTGRTIQLGRAVLVNSENEKMRIEITIHRVAYTSVGLLTGEDATRDGFLGLGQLHDAIRKHYPESTLDDVATIYYFNRTDREEN